MTKVVCAPAGVSSAAADLKIVLFDYADEWTGEIGATIPVTLRRKGLVPAQRAWDLLALALSVYGADYGISRSASPDGWTRQIELDVAVTEPDFWTTQAELLNRQLRFLTTDVWHTAFMPDGMQFEPPRQPQEPEQDSIVLLSGGLDSLIGASDLATRHRKNPYAVSQVSPGDKKNQRVFASRIGTGLAHLQLNHHALLPGPIELSHRSRSIVFLAYGVLAATSLRRYHSGETIKLYVCENGFISLNPPLTSSRLGSLSTRTTHPGFIAQFQQLLDNAGLRVEIVNPYQFLTKGEMLRQASDQKLLKRHAKDTTSCGRFGRHAYRHCGRCVPCLVRRAAFHAWGVEDVTEYVYPDLMGSDHDDVRSAAVAVLQAEELGVARWATSSMSPTLLGDVTPYREVISRGLAELANYLKAVHVL